MVGYQLDDIVERLHTAVLSDTLDQCGLAGQVMAPGITPVERGMRLAGRARTARAVAVTARPAEPYARLLEAMDSLQKDDVLVIGFDNPPSSALFGGLLATAAQSAGARGVVVGGPTRDTDEIRRIGLPTFAQGAHPLDSLGRDEVAEIDVEVVVGGVRVRRGDLVVADADGVVVVPSSFEERVVTMAFEKVAKEGVMRTALLEGMSLVEAFETFKVL